MLCYGINKAENIPNIFPLEALLFLQTSDQAGIIIQMKFTSELQSIHDTIQSNAITTTISGRKHLKVGNIH